MDYSVPQNHWPETMDGAEARGPAHAKSVDRSGILLCYSDGCFFCAGRGRSLTSPATVANVRREREEDSKLGRLAGLRPPQSDAPPTSQGTSLVDNCTLLPSCFTIPSYNPAPLPAANLFPSRTLLLAHCVPCVCL